MLLKIIAEISCRNKIFQRDSLPPIGSGFQQLTYATREGKRIRNVYLGSSLKMSLEEAQGKAKAMKREALGLSPLITQ